MPRFSAQPPKTCIETKQLEVALLSKHGLLLPGHRCLTATWFSPGEESLFIKVDSFVNPAGASYLLLSYTLACGHAHEYRVELVRVASNLPSSTAGRFYLVCPVTGRRAAILYLRQGTELFAHRQAYPTKRLYYDSQLEQKRHRGLAKRFQAEKAWDKEYLRKYRKTTYAGKVTRWLTALEMKTLRARFATTHAILRLGALYYGEAGSAPADAVEALL